MIAHQPIKLYDATDTSWIATVVDQVVASTGEPWRVLLERLEHTSVRPARVAAILGALRRVTGGRAERAKIARQVRALVLGHPALDDAEHRARLQRASDTLGVDVDEVRSLLWIDLANERPVTLPFGRPAELRLAAYANLDRIQRAVRRARNLRLRVWGDAHALIRTARRYGLLATVARERDARAAHDAGTPPRDSIVTVIDVIGPLSLFHATTVYGRALASLMPLLAEQPRFELVLSCDFGRGATTLTLAPPVLLPALPSAARTPSLAARLARELAKLAPDARIELDPPPIAVGSAARADLTSSEVLYPDLAVELDGVRWSLEILGFATAELIVRRLASYAAADLDGAGRRALLCIDAKRSPGTAGDVHGVLAFRGRLDARSVLAAIAGTSPSAGGPRRSNGPGR